ncbi:MAG: outer membrane beta-barrel protein [Cytophagales bacterium]|jgi:hypothetical protein|nr:outer membrane beta-barrel protein [Cytophagales bacterium]MCA6383580.1 outer membrane beta-barrel protein [Cytophagales bacterium]
MKRIILIVYIGFCLVPIAYSQNYKKLRIGIGAGYATAYGNASNGGQIITVEPSLRINDSFSIGLRLESAFITRGFLTPIPPETTVDVNPTNSYGLNCQYYFSRGSFRPFIGTGFGIYSLAEVRTSRIGDVKAESKFGFYPRVGFDLNHFTIALDYNILTPSTASNGDVNNNHFDMRVVFYFGGGRKK